MGAWLPDGRVIEYVVDGLNRRVGKRVNGAVVEGFLYDGQLRPVAWLDGGGAVKATFVYGLHVNVPEYMTTSSGTYRFIHDHLGSPRLVVDSSSGAVVQRMDYDSFGQVLADSSPGFQPFGFAGGLWDRDTGLVKFGARDYDPAVGRWTNKDPVRFRGGWNLYEYVANDPINLTDPTGRAAIIINMGSGPVTSSYTSPSGGQTVFTIPPGGWSGPTTHDPDTLIFGDGTVVKLPDGNIVVITDTSTLDTFEPSDLDLVSPLSQILGLGPRPIPDPEGEFGPFRNPDGSPYPFPKKCP